MRKMGEQETLVGQGLTGIFSKKVYSGRHKGIFRSSQAVSGALDI